MKRGQMIPTRFSHFLAIFTIFTLVSGCKPQAPAPPTHSPVPPTATALPTVTPTPTLTPEEQLNFQIADYVTGLADAGRFSGSILVAREGQVLISQGYGMANLEHSVPNTPQTKFRVGSITKQFTAMAILMLQQQGKLNVQDPICPYIFHCPEAWAPITIHQLLTHTSGIYNFTNSSKYIDFKKQFMSPNNIIDTFRDQPLDFTPGENWSYNNSGYILLGYIVEKASGLGYQTYLLLNIFEPLNMVNTLYDDPRTVIQNRAQGYLNRNTNADYIDMSVPYAAGGLLSTVEDLFLWDQALYTDKLIPQSLRDEMFTPFEPIPDSDFSYGYGWYIGTRFDQQLIYHGGGVEGFSTIIDRYPENKVVIIVLGNRFNIDVSPIASEIGKLVFGEE